MKKTKLLVAPLKIFSRRKYKKPTKANAKTNVSQLSTKKVLRNFLLFSYSTMTYYNIVFALFAFFFKDKCVASCFVYDRISITRFFLLQTHIGVFQTHYEKLLTRTAVIVINMPLWSTHEIELLIREIEEMLWFWNMFNPEYNNTIKKSDAWKEVSEVLD